MILLHLAVSAVRSGMRALTMQIAKPRDSGVVFCLAGNGNGNNNVGLVNGIGNGNFNGAGTLETSSPCHLHSANCCLQFIYCMTQTP